MVRYFWSESNGTNRPTVRYMDFEPSTEYYNGMPLKKNEAGAVMPTTGEPEYICMWDYQPDGDIRTLEIPVIEIFPDTIYEKWNEDGTVEEVRFGSGGGGGGVSSWNDLTDKPFGETIAELYSVENGTFPLFMGQMPMHFVPDSMVLINGQTYTVVWDGVPYDCVYTYMDGMGMMGNFGAMEGADTGEPFVYMYAPAEGMQGFMDIAAIMSGNLTETSHSFSVTGFGVKKIDTQFIPAVAWNAESDEVPIRNQPCKIYEKHEYEWDGDITGREKVEAYRNNNYIFWYVKMDELDFRHGYYAVKCTTMNAEGIASVGYDVPERTHYSHGVSWGSNQRRTDLFESGDGKGLPDFIQNTNSSNVECSLGNGFSVSKGVWFLYVEDLSGNVDHFTTKVKTYTYENYLTSAYFMENSIDVESLWADRIVLRSKDRKKFFSIEVDDSGKLTAVEV